MKNLKSLTILMCIFLTTAQTSCQKRKSTKEDYNETKEYNIKEEDVMIQNVLQKQLKQGANHYINEAGVEIPKDKFETKELEATVKIADNILSSNGFKKLSNQEFADKLKEIFNRTIDLNSDKPYLYINFFNKCDKNMSYYPYNGIDYNGTYIIKNNNFITNFYYIPELLNYKKDFPEISKIEDNISKNYKKNGNSYTIELWKELENNTDISYNLTSVRKKNAQTLVARNMYLFNDSRAHFRWLIINDEFFMKNLVTTFGYTKDKELLKWVLQKNRLVNNSDTNNFEDYGKILWHKTCNEKFVFHHETLEEIKSEISPATPNYIDDLLEYVYYLDKEKTGELNYKQKAFIIAHIFNFILEMSQQQQYSRCLYKVGGYYEESTSAERQSLDKEFKDNNYYNLKNFRTLWEEAKEAGDGVARPGEY